MQWVHRSRRHRQDDFITTIHATMTSTKELVDIGNMKRICRDSRATGWFHPSSLLGTWSPSTHLFTSSHQGVLSLHIPFMPSFELTASTQRADLEETRAAIQSIVRPARCSSSSRAASSMSAKSENLRANDACGTDVSEVVRVVTTYPDETILE